MLSVTARGKPNGLGSTRCRSPTLSRISGQRGTPIGSSPRTKRPPWWRPAPRWRCSPWSVGSRSRWPGATSRPRPRWLLQAEPGCGRRCRPARPSAELADHLAHRVGLTLDADPAQHAGAWRGDLALQLVRLEQVEGVVFADGRAL